jgi:predicted nucleotidyltransferase
MNPLLAEKIEAIGEACQRHGVGTLHAFGSVLRDDFDPARSDVDLLVSFLPRDEGHADAFFGLLEELERVLGRPVDLVVERAIRNRYFREAVQRQRVPVYDHAA